MWRLAVAAWMLNAIIVCTRHPPNCLTSPLFWHSLILGAAQEALGPPVRQMPRGISHSQDLGADYVATSLLEAPPRLVGVGIESETGAALFKLSIMLLKSPDPHEHRAIGGREARRFWETAERSPANPCRPCGTRMFRPKGLLMASVWMRNGGAGRMQGDWQPTKYLRPSRVR